MLAGVCLWRLPWLVALGEGYQQRRARKFAVAPTDVTGGLLREFSLQGADWIDSKGSGKDHVN